MSTSHKVVSRQDWEAARKELLEREKRHTRERDELAKMRRDLPWVKVEKKYQFEGPNGKVALGDLFEGRSQLIVQHVMFSPDWDAGCVGCSFGADHIEAALIHLLNHDVSVVRISRAPLEKLTAFKQRMGWKAPWLSSGQSDFNYDFGVSFTPEQVGEGKAVYNYVPLTSFSMEDLPGLSFFIREDDGSVYHTYSAYARGDESICSAFMLLDMTPKGRNENGPHFKLMDWVKHHDSYPQTQSEGACGGCCH